MAGFVAGTVIPPRLRIRQEARIRQLHRLHADKTVGLNLQSSVLEELHRCAHQQELTRDGLAECARATVLGEETPDGVICAVAGVRRTTWVGLRESRCWGEGRDEQPDRERSATEQVVEQVSVEVHEGRWIS